jgi:AbiU2
MMPAHVKEMFEGLQQELWHLHIKVEFWNQLFGSSRLRRELLDRMAKLLFDHLNDSLFVDIISRVTRMNDPIMSARRKNWNFASFKELVERDLSPLGIDLDLGRFTSETTCINPLFKEIRNRHIAHKDWERRNEPIFQIFPPHLTKMLEAMRGFMNTIEEHYEGTTTKYNSIETNSQGDGVTLIQHLKELAVLRKDKAPEHFDTWDLPL